MTNPFNVNKLFSLVLAALAFASCQSSDNSSSGPSPDYPAATNQTPVTDADPDGSPASTITAQPQMPAATNTVALNPPHGMPGHRCDIEVGAPLNAPAGGAPAPVIMQNGPAANPSGGSVRLNPAHGQPGHDCSIPVGQPLRG